MRKWGWDGVSDPEASEFGEFILTVSFSFCLRGAVEGDGCNDVKFSVQLYSRDTLPHHHHHPSTNPPQCGRARFPNNPELLITYANFFIEVREIDADREPVTVNCLCWCSTGPAL